MINLMCSLIAVLRRDMVKVKLIEKFVKLLRQGYPADK